MTRKKKKQDDSVLLSSAIMTHFSGTLSSDIVTAKREFPSTARVDLQKAIEQALEGHISAKVLGIHREYSHSTVTFSDLLHDSNYPAVIGPLAYDEIDTGDEFPSRCLNQALFLAETNELKFALLLAQVEKYGQAGGTMIEIAVPAGENGLDLSRSLLDQIEKLVARSGSYRGKVLSLEEGVRYSGKAGQVRVHKLRSVSRDELILPERTVAMLDRNVTAFIQQRHRLKELGMQTKKGLLFYGPPGTGKTHTIHYLAGQLADHTTLLITASQVGLLEEYFQLARFLQPAMVVLEDVDLIARDRNQMRGGCEETLLNRLLNEMDGLRADADVLFVLTTNHPESLEQALSARPGRVDQAIEFPLPDKEGRRKLVKLYSCGLTLDDELCSFVVDRTERASPAFIKELMRRSAQNLLQEPGSESLKIEHINLALEDMLFTGGSLNVKLLGGAISVSSQN